MKRVFRILITALLVPAAFILQTTLCGAISLAGITPDLIMAVTVSLAILLGEAPAILTGFFMGLLCDIFSMELLGFYALCYSFAGFVCGRLGRNLFIDDLKFPAVLIMAADLFKSLYGYLFLFLLQNRIFTGTFLVRFAVPEAVYTMLISVPVYAFLAFLYRNVLKDKPETSKEEIRIAPLS